MASVIGTYLGTYSSAFVAGQAYGSTGGVYESSSTQLVFQNNVLSLLSLAQFGFPLKIGAFLLHFTSQSQNVYATVLCRSSTIGAVDSIIVLLQRNMVVLQDGELLSVLNVSGSDETMLVTTTVF